MPGSFIVKNTDESRDSLFKPVKTISSRIEANYKGIGLEWLCQNDDRLSDRLSDIVGRQ